MKFWQLFLISMLAMAAMVQAQEQPPEDVEPEENGDDEGHAEPEAEPAAEDGAGDEDDGAAEPEPEGTDEPQEGESSTTVNNTESSKTAGLESDSGATSACFSFSTVILSTLVALKFAH
ncbi:neurofilament light polypeptide-like isoform X2 [Palaemon carinicauda]